MLEVLREDYVTTARAKGLTEFIVMYKHALRNALISVVALLFLSLPWLIGGSVVIETIFSWPGMGRLYYNAAVGRDYPVLMAILIIYSGLMILSNLLADIVYGLVDPRIRFE